MKEQHFLEFDYDYDRQSLVDLYEEYILEFPAEKNARSPFRAISDNLDLSTHDVISKMYDLFPSIPRRSHFFTLSEVRRAVRPHTNPRNNGTVFFPLSGSLSIDFYTFEAPLDFDGRPMFSPMPEDRPQLTEEQEKELMDSKFITLDVTRPVAINGLKIHGYKPTSLEPPIFAIFKIPLDSDWDSIVNGIISSQQQ